MIHIEELPDGIYQVKDGQLVLEGLNFPKGTPRENMGKLFSWFDSPCMLFQVEMGKCLFLEFSTGNRILDDKLDSHDKDFPLYCVKHGITLLNRPLTLGETNDN